MLNCVTDTKILLLHMLQLLENVLIIETQHILPVSYEITHPKLTNRNLIYPDLVPTRNQQVTHRLELSPMKPEVPDISSKLINLTAGFHAKYANMMLISQSSTPLLCRLIILLNAEPHNRSLTRRISTSRPNTRTSFGI
jgi:hypothetical protein